MSKTLKKAPKKIKTLVLKTGKNRVSTLETMKNPWEHTKTKKLQVKVNNSNVKKDSDYETSSSDSDSESDDEYKFNPKVQLGNRKVEIKKDEPLTFNGIDIAYIPTNKDDIEQRLLHKKGYVPRGYSNFIVIVGSIGSGKTNVLINMLLNPLIYGYDNTDTHWFDNVFVLTNSNDDAYDTLVKEKVLEANQIKHQPSSKDLKKVLDEQKNAIKLAGEDIGKIPNTCIIFDDIIDDQQFIKSKEFKLCAIRPRQMRICGILLSQHFNAIPRINRLNAQDLILFAGSKTDEEMYADMLCPAGMTKKQFSKLLNIAWEKKPDDKYPFLYVNRKNKTFSRNFTEIIDITKL